MIGTRRSWLALSAAAVLIWTAAAPPAAAQGKDVLVFAAASLKNALDEVDAQWQRESGKKVVISYAASSALAKQIEQGAPADIFISADLDWMDYVAQKNLIKPDTRSNLLGNRHRAGRAEGCEPQRRRSSPASTSPRCSATAGSRWPTSMPCRPAKYGKAALEKLGAWAASRTRSRRPRTCAPRCCWCRAARRPLGIVYQTDAAADPTVKIVGTFPEKTPSADHLSDRADRRIRAIPTRRPF